MDPEETTNRVLEAAARVHALLGPGLLEVVYEAALAVDLAREGLPVERQKEIPVSYAGTPLGTGFRADLLVGGVVLVEVLSVEAITELHRRTVHSHLRLVPVPVGLLINFNTVDLGEGILRLGPAGPVGTARPLRRVDARKGAEVLMGGRPRS